MRAETMLFIGLLIAAALLLFIGCATKIEDRCINNGLQIQTLDIEETFNGKQRSKVRCTFTKDGF